MASVLAAVDGGEITNGPALERLGYAEQNPTLPYRLTPEARYAGPAANRGDARAASRRRRRAQERAKKTAAAAEEKKKRGQKPIWRRGGKAKPDKAAEVATNRASVGQQPGLNLDALEPRGDGRQHQRRRPGQTVKGGLLANDGQPDRRRAEAAGGRR